MKYTEEREKSRTKNGKYLINGCYYYLSLCRFCGEKCFTINKDGGYCGNSCSKKDINPTAAKPGVENFFYNKEHSKESLEQMSIHHRENNGGSSNPNWKGGVTKLKIPLYDTCAPHIEKYEEVRCSEEGYLEVKCTYCGKWFIPKVGQVGARINGINGNDINRFYCSDSCKKECPIFWQRNHYKGQKGTNSREVQPQLRQLVFLRDNYRCRKCSSKDSLHCHHMEGVEQNPIESADVDMCITLCKDCHKEVHKQPGCTYRDMMCG